jgi:hypothetical protein
MKEVSMVKASVLPSGYTVLMQFPSKLPAMFLVDSKGLF